MDRIINKWLMLIALTVMTVITALAVPQSEFRRLDSLIAVQPQLIAAKEARLAQMKADLSGLRTTIERYQAKRRLYEEYSAYQYDSA